MAVFVVKYHQMPILKGVTVPMEQNDKRPPEQDGKRPKSKLPLLLLSVVVILVISMIASMVSDSQYTKTTFSDFMDEVEKNNIAEVEVHHDRILYMTKDEAAKPANDQKACFTGLPSGDVLRLVEDLDAKGITVNYTILEDNSGIVMVLYYLVSIGLLFVFMNFITKRPSSGRHR